MISESCDIMSVCEGTNNKLMNVIKDTYKSIVNVNSVNADAVVTGKGFNLGGLNLYNASSGIGIANTAIFLDQNIEKQKFLQTSGFSSGGKKSVIIKGFNARGYNAAKTLSNRNDFKIVGVIHGNIGIYNQIGIDPDEIKDYLTKNKDSLEGLSKNTFSPNELLTRTCDIVIITENKEFDMNIDLVKELKCKVLIEGINASPLTFEAEDYLLKKGTVIVPSLLSFSGEFICGYLEWLKNLEHRNLTILFKRYEKNFRMKFINQITKGNQKNTYQGPTESELVMTTTAEMMDEGFNKMIMVAQDQKLNLRTAAFSIALNRIYQHYQEKGITLTQ